MGDGVMAGVTHQGNGWLGFSGQRRDPLRIPLRGNHIALVVPLSPDLLEGHIYMLQGPAGGV